MLKRAAPMLLAGLIACTSPAEPAAPTQKEVRAVYAPVFFFDGDGLIPEYIELGDGEVADQLFRALAAGPEHSNLATAVPADARVRGEFERNEKLFLDLSASFWSGNYETVRRRIAQVLYTFAALEEGRTVRLLAFEGHTSPRMRQLISKPLERTDLVELAPWILPIRPVAGSIVSTTVPIDVELRPGYSARAYLNSSGKRVSPVRLKDGSGELTLPEDAPGELSIVIEAKGPDGKHHVDLNVTFIAS